MNKAELINAVAATAEVSKKDAEAVVSATLDAITAALTEGEKVQLVGFGSFEVKKRAARIGRNPKTKEAIERGLRPPFRFPPPVTSVTGERRPRQLDRGIFPTYMPPEK